MGNVVREFMTHREPDEHIWVERDEEMLIGTVRAGQRPMPRIRVFDLLESHPGGSQALVWDGETLRIAEQATPPLPQGSYVAVATLRSTNFPVQERVAFELR